MRGNEADVPPMTRHFEIDVGMVARRFDGIARLRQDGIVGRIDEEGRDADAGNEREAAASGVIVSGIVEAVERSRARVVEGPDGGNADQAVEVE